MGPSPALNPAQQQVMDALAASRDTRPVFEPELAEELRAYLDDELSEVMDHSGLTEPLWVSKRGLAQIHGCQAQWKADRDIPFAYSTPTARGTLAHTAIEIGTFWRGDANPMDLVDEAFTRLERSDKALGTFLHSIDEGERAQLGAFANERVAKFQECFPPLDPKWRPVLESSIRAELADKRLVLTGKPDLTLGIARGREAGKVIIDLKTGGSATAHTDDLRFYALLELLRMGIPPRRLASYYLDTGTLHTEDVTPALMETAARRVADGVRKMVAILSGTTEPAVVAGPPCNWCSLIEHCDTGQEHLRSRLALE